MKYKEFIAEKKLTTAELKKREEVAKAIERDNPDMPMDKKMAIATATAKKVAESEELEESDVVRNVGGRKFVSAEAALKLARELAQKRKAGSKASHDDLKKAIGHFKESEEVEQIVEVKHRVAVTVSDPNHTAVSKRKEQLQKVLRLTADNEQHAVERAKAHYKKQGYKVHGASHAGTVSEEVELEEGIIKAIKRISAGKDLKARISQEISKSQQASMSGDTKTANKHFKRFDKLDKLTKEETEQMDEKFINAREYASHGLIHPTHAGAAYHKVGSNTDFYAHGSGDKLSGTVTKNDGKEVHFKADKHLGGKVHKFKVSSNLPKQVEEAKKKKECGAPLENAHDDDYKEKKMDEQMKNPFDWKGYIEQSKKQKGVKSTGDTKTGHEVKKISTGTVYTKKANKDGEYSSHDEKKAAGEEPVKRGRGRPAGSYGSYKARSAETNARAAAKAAASKAANRAKLKEAFDEEFVTSLFEGFTEEQEFLDFEDLLQCEEFEQLDELSKDTMNSYIKKALWPNPKKTEKRVAGIVKAARKLSKPTNEETELEEEQINELSKATLKSYFAKSAIDRYETLRKAKRKDKKGQDIKPEAERMAKREDGMVKSQRRLAKEDVEQVEEMDKLALRGLHSANPQSVPDYKRSTEAGKKSVAKKNIPDLKNAIKSSLGKHTKPVLPEEVEIEEGVGKDYSASPAGYKDQPKEKLQSVGGDGYKRNRHIKELQQLLSSVDTKYPITHTKNKTVLDKIHSKLKKLDEEVEHITEEEWETMSDDDFDNLIENLEQLDELSGSTLRSYAKKAKSLAAGADASADLHRDIGDTDSEGKLRRFAAKKSAGAAKAVAKDKEAASIKKHFGMKEEVESLDENVTKVAAFKSKDRDGNQHNFNVYKNAKTGNHYHMVVNPVTKYSHGASTVIDDKGKGHAGAEAHAKEVVALVAKGKHKEALDHLNKQAYSKFSVHEEFETQEVEQQLDESINKYANFLARTKQ